MGNQKLVLILQEEPFRGNDSSYKLAYIAPFSVRTDSKWQRPGHLARLTEEPQVQG